MDKSINKLIYLLKRTYNELTYSIKNNYFNGSEEERQKELLTCHFTGNLGLWLIQNKQFSKEHKLIFEEFNVLSDILMSPEFNRKDIFNIIFYVIKKNIELSLLDPEMEIKIGEIDDSKYLDTLTTKEALLGYRNDETYYDTYVKIQTIRFSQENTNEKNYQGLFNKELSSLDNLKEQHSIINTKYLQKEDSFTLEDIEEILTSLRNLGVNEFCILTIKEQLTFRIEKRNKKEERVEVYQFRPKIEEPKKPEISRREYKKIFKELSTYYDFETSTPLKTLSHEELIYCIAQLKRIDWNEVSLEIFLRKADKYNLTNDPILHCKNLITRLKNNSENLHESSDLDDIQNAIHALEEYLLEYEKSTSLIEQEEWKELIKSELVYSNRLIPKTI